MFVLLGPPVILFYFICILRESDVGNDTGQRIKSSDIDASFDFWSSSPSRSFEEFQEDDRSVPYPFIRIIRQESKNGLSWTPDSVIDNFLLSHDNKKLSDKSSYSGILHGQKVIADNILLNMTNFHFLKNASHVCQAPSSSSLSGYSLSHNYDERNTLLLLAFVHSAPNNFVKRQVIRSTWASPAVTKKLNVKVIFLLGLSNSSVIQSLIDKESNEYQDLVQGNFIDSYKNLTYKHLTGLRWVGKFCSESTKFVMKVDDDAFVDIFQVSKSLNRMMHLSSPSFSSSSTLTLTTSSSSRAKSSMKPTGILACSLFPDGTAVKRRGKWAVTLDEYPFETYPRYCSGIAYFTTPDVAAKLFQAAHLPGIKVLWIDDVFVTGVLPAVIRQPHQSLGMKFTYDHHRLRSWSTRRDLKTNPYFVCDVGDALDWQELMMKLWEKTLKVLK